MLLGEDFRRRHERDLQPVLHRDERGHQCHDRLAGTDVSLEQPVHRLDALHVADDLGNRLLLISGQLERQHRPRGFADLIGDDDRPRFPLAVRVAAAKDDPELEEKELLENQAPMRGRAKAVEIGEIRSFGREMDVG